MQRIAIYAVVLLVVFLLGFIPMWLKANERANNLAAAQRELRLLQIQNPLASAVIDARRAEYEPARQAASNFFTSLNAEVDRGSDSALTQPQREKITPLVTERDELITLLARSDPASADRLSNLYVSYRKIIDG
jgi:Tfp pilus assembly protein PilV